MIRKLEIEEVNKLYKKHIKIDFPTFERAPCYIIKKNMKKGIEEGFIYKEDYKELAYAFVSISEEAVLISLFAVFNKNRGNGIGTKFLKELLEYYNTKKAIIVEVERTEDKKKKEERMICKKRVDFYERLGFKLYKDIKYKLFGCSYYLMVYGEKILLREEIIHYVKKIYGDILNKYQRFLKIK